MRFAVVALVAVAALVPKVDGLTVATQKHPTAASLLDALSPCPGTVGCKEQLLAVQVGQAVTIDKDPDGIITQVDKAQSAKKWVQYVVLWISIVLALSTFVLGYTTLLYNHSNPRPAGLGKAYISDSDAADSDVEKVDTTLPQTFKSTDSMPTDSTKISHANSIYMEKGKCVTKDAADLVDECGISALCLLPGDTLCGITHMQSRYAVPLIAFQANSLQLGMIYFLASCLMPRHHLHAHFEELPVSIVFIAIYLHFLNCTQEVPWAWQILHHLADFHDNLPDLLLFGGIFLMDSFVVPLMSFTLGALYLCTSRSIGDVILNAVAVAFISDIDNWILVLNSRVNLLAGQVSNKTVNIPANRHFMRYFAWTVVFFPVVPLAASAGFCFFGFHVLQL